MSTPSLLPSVEVGAVEAADAAVIWMHGLGASGHDFEPIVPELGLPASARVRFVFPHAPVRPVTVNGGIVMPAWYDLATLGGPRHVDDVDGLRDSEAHIRRLIERENARGVPSERIVLAGFSQGGAVALQTGLRYPERLAGIMALSTYLPLPEALASERSEANRQVPIFMAHGRWDQVVAYPFGRQSADVLEELGYAVDWRDYQMEHNVTMEEVRDIAAWLRQVLAL